MFDLSLRLEGENADGVHAIAMQPEQKVSSLHIFDYDRCRRCHLARFALAMRD